jgi:hypothetical protein
MTQQRFFLFYLLMAVITFGDVTTQPGWQRESDKATSPEKASQLGGQTLFVCAVWPLWWSARLFTWLKPNASKS